MVLIFDYDGTIHDTACIYGHAVRSVLAELAQAGFTSEKECSDKSLSAYLGMTPRQMWEDFMPDLPADIRQKAIAKVGLLMREGILSGSARLYDGAEDLLSSLKAEGHTLVMLSNCGQDYMDTHRAYFSLDRWFSEYYCSGAYQDAPKEVIFETIRKAYPGRYVMIGDRASDIRVGLLHHIPTIACGYGYGNEEECSGADYVAGSVQELGKCLREMTGRLR